MGTVASRPSKAAKPLFAGAGAEAGSAAFSLCFSAFLLSTCEECAGADDDPVLSGGSGGSVGRRLY